MSQPKACIGVFDSGYGGLTILQEIRALLPEYNYIYLGDNARTPYGTRSFEIVYEYTKQGVEKLFDLGCELVILACNTASAKALRNIQQKDLPQLDIHKRVLGVIRPTAEIIGSITQTGHIGIMGTEGTIQSESYLIEIKKLYPNLTIIQQACPMWVPIIENAEHLNNGADYFVKKYLNQLLSQDTQIDSIILACTHYPLLLNKIKEYAPKHINIIAQGGIIGDSLADYLTRHSEIEQKLSKQGTCQYFTTESADKFSASASIFLKEKISAEHIIIS